MRRIAAGLTVFASLLAITACADSTAPRPSANGKSAPSGASHTRYILASGDIPVAGCEEIGGGYWLCDDGGAETAAATAAPANPDSSSDTENSQGENSGN